MASGTTEERELSARGWTVRRSVFTAGEVAGFRSAVSEAVARAGKGPQITTATGTEGSKVISIADLLSFDGIAPVVVDPRIIDLATDLLGTTPRYFGDSGFLVGATGDRTWHRDNVDRDFDGPDWKDPYPVVRIGIYLQDHARSSGGLSVAEGSHLTAENRGRGRFPDLGVGDVAAWSLRTRHGAEAVRLRLLPDLVLNPRLQSRVPRWARVPVTEERMALFVSFARPDPLLDRYLDYLGTREYFTDLVRVSDYSPATVDLIGSAGVELVGPARDLAAGV